ncbi:hypothetical protein CLAIMM_03068 [Cladophialophora immunda]|nr:hypothetical protein CLAIMM_03068 [Cladophialophora immunda]
MYEKLKLENGLNIRFLKLEPGVTDDPIRCRLLPSSLEGNPSYECISYVWDGLPGSATIVCEGQLVEIKANLYAALKALRYANKVRTIWVDALCINQRDDAEKSQQVPLMAQIYGRARLVLLWLGTSQSITEQAFDKLRLLAMFWGQRVAQGADKIKNPDEQKRWLIDDRSYLDDKSVFDITREPAALHQGTAKLPHPLQMGDKCGSQWFEFDNLVLWEAVDNLFASPFFSRAWIVQEVALAQDALIQCGRFSLPWQIFQNAHNGRIYLTFYKSRSTIGTLLHGVPTAKMARHWFRHPDYTIDFACVVGLFGFSKASDPRDYIYAALGMVKVDHGILPNYQKDVEQVYLEAATQMISQGQDLFLWRSNNPPQRKRYKTLPTWVPDWSVEDDPYCWYHPSPKFWKCLPNYFTINERRLGVVTHFLDKICFVARVRADDTVLGPARNLIQTLEGLGFAPFDVYRAERLVEEMPLRTRQSLNECQDVRLSRLGHAFSILTKLDGVPDSVLKILSRLLDPGHRAEDHKMLNIEALWNALCNSGSDHARSTRPGFTMFLAFWYCSSVLNGQVTRLLGVSKLPKAYDVWVEAAVKLLLSEQSCRTSFEVLISEHLSHVDEEEDLFVTQSGYIGRCAAGAAKPGHQVAILGGAFRPFLLEKQVSGNFRFVSYTYVEGVMSLDSPLPAHAEVHLIQIE